MHLSIVASSPAVKASHHQVHQTHRPRLPSRLAAFSLPSAAVCRGSGRPRRRLAATVTGFVSASIWFNCGWGRPRS